MSYLTGEEREMSEDACSSKGSNTSRYVLTGGATHILEQQSPWLLLHGSVSGQAPGLLPVVILL